MPTNEEFEELKGRIVELESKLAQAQEGVTVRRPADSISAEDMQAYVRVRDVIAPDYGEFCGINDCFRCIVSRCYQPCVVQCITRCINECTCGPCNIDPGFIPGGMHRFGGLGG
ncbi:MAG TPA: hypothetical protein VLO09_02170 [Ornithinimicrobium sp.]|nr:hypothetical protein [Ornithinimicrobium sp.]